MRTNLFLALICVLGACHGPNADTVDPATNTDPAILVFSNEADPNFELYQRFTLSLSDPASAHVACEDDNDPLDRHVLTSDLVATEHIFELYGLRAEQRYTCVGTVGSASAQLNFGTESLPFDALPNLDFTVERHPDHADDGYLLYTHFPLGSTNREVILFLDLDGHVRWYHKVVDDLTFAGLDVSYVGDGELLIGGGGLTHLTGTGDGLPPILMGLDGIERWRAPRSDHGQPHHHANLLDSGDVLWLDSVNNTLGDNEWVGFLLRRMTPGDSAPNFDWSSQTAVDRGQLDPGLFDPYHANSALYTEDEDGPGYYVSLKSSNTIVRIDAGTGDITWRLGLGGDFALFDADGALLDSPDDWFSSQHDPQLNGNRLLMHDNQRQTPGIPTRALELELDVPNRTATVVWQWREEGWHEGVYGDVDRLPNGNVLITQGRGFGSNTDDRLSRIIEVDPATDEVVWRLTLGDNMTVYQSDRVDGCAVFSNTRYCDAR